MGYGDRDKGPDTAILTLLFLLLSLLFISNSGLWSIPDAGSGRHIRGYS